jgi:hypothetical protein
VRKNGKAWIPKHSITVICLPISETSVSIELQSDAGAVLGTLQCFFFKTQTPTDITAGRWLAAAGSAVSLEVPNH